jgi:NADPH:quinone reductase-like Zn-dependent oxidoreductase
LGLHVCLPHLDPDSSGNSSSLRSILVLGGSSGIGAIAIQLLRLALPSATILTTSSAKHHTHLISLGASKCFERCAQGNTADIKIATPGGLGVDAILDTVQAAAGQQAVFTSLSLSGPMLYSQVRTGMTVEVPEGINSTEIDGRQILGTEGGENALPALASLIQSGRFKLPNKVEIVGNGPTGIQQGLDKLMKGVSGAKYIVAFVAV